MDKYELLNQIGDGTFGSVAKAVNKKNGQLVAIKKMKQKFFSWEECIKLPEVVVIRRIHRHPNVVKLSEVIRENNELFFVFEYMDGDLLGVIKKAKKAQPPQEVHLSPAIPYHKVKDYMRQLLQALAYLHKRGYFHRDLKPENLLIRRNEQGEEIVKLGDFGLVKEVRARPPFTDYVSTRWYRAPELLLQDRAYNAPVDIFASGCIMSELITTRPLFPGSNEVDQLGKIMAVLGSPTEKTWPGGFALARKIPYKFPSIPGRGLAADLPKHIPAQALHLMNQMLQYDPKRRPTAEQCLAHPYFNVGIDENTAATAEQKVRATQALESSPATSPQPAPTTNDTAGGKLSDGPGDPKRYLTAQPPLNSYSNANNVSPQKFYMVGIPKLSTDQMGVGSTSNTNPSNNTNTTTTTTTTTTNNHHNENGAGNGLSNLRSPYQKQGLQRTKALPTTMTGKNHGIPSRRRSEEKAGVGQGASPGPSAVAKDAAVEARVDLEELLSEFTGELNLQGLRTEKMKPGGEGGNTDAQRTGGGSPVPSGLSGSKPALAPGSVGATPHGSLQSSTEGPGGAAGYQRRTSLMAGKRPTDLTASESVNALLNHSRYKKSSFSIPPAYGPGNPHNNTANNNNNNNGEGGARHAGGVAQLLHSDTTSDKNLGGSTGSGGTQQKTTTHQLNYAGKNYGSTNNNSHGVSPSIRSLLARRQQQQQQQQQPAPSGSHSTGGGGFGFK